MVTYANGSVPASVLAPLDGQPEARLRADAAAAWNRARADVRQRTGIVLTVRGWNRTLAEQVGFYLQRHRLARPGERICCRWQGRGYVFTGAAHAAPPGTSNHGWGVAIDVDDFGVVGQFNHPRRVATFPILAAHGWTDTEGRGAIREPWHLVYDPARDTRPVSRPGASPGASTGKITLPTIPGRPAPLTVQEDDMLLIRDNATGAVMLVLGGIGSPVAGPDYAAYQRAGIPVAGVTPEGYATATRRYLNR